MIVIVCLLIAAQTAFSQGPLGPMPPESIEDLQKIEPGDKGPIPNDEFRALAQAQITAIAYMCDLYHLDKGTYPVDLYALQASPYWLADMNNLLTGQPLDQVAYTPGPSDFIPDQYAKFMAEQLKSEGPPVGGELGNPEQGEQPSGAEGEGGESSQQNSPRQQQQQQQRRITFDPPQLDPIAIGCMEPGNVLFYSQKGASLQLIIWMNDTVFYDHYQTGPYSLASARFALVRKIKPSDEMIMRTAVLLEEVLPRSYGLWQFMADLEPLLPKDLASLSWDKRLEIFEKLQIFPRNPISKKRLEMSADFQPGAVADLGNGAIPPVYFLEDGRMRTLREMTDKVYLGEHQQEIIARERKFLHR
ncbi:MAG: hypothetical protein HRF49_01730 [bacterium]|jgi:hypothetical protein